MTAGDMKVSLSVSDWPFCDPSTAPTRNGQETPSTACAGVSSAFETGAYLDATLVVQGPSASMPVLQDDEGTDGGGLVGAGMKYIMSGGSADSILVMSEWVQTEEYGWTKVGTAVVV